MTFTVNYSIVKSKLTVNGRKKVVKIFRILRGEMVKADLTISQLSNKIGISEKSLRNKMNGKTEFTWKEVLEIRKIIAPAMSLEELFKTA